MTTTSCGDRRSDVVRDAQGLQSGNNWSFLPVFEALAEIGNLVCVGSQFRGYLISTVSKHRDSCFLTSVVMMLAGWATFVDRVLRAAMALAACAEETSEVSEALFAASFQSLAVKDPDNTEALRLVSAGAVGVEIVPAFATSGVSTRAEEIVTATEREEILILTREMLFES